MGDAGDSNMAALHEQLKGLLSGLAECVSNLASGEECAAHTRLVGLIGTSSEALRRSAQAAAATQRKDAQTQEMAETLFTLKGLLKKQQKTISVLQRKKSNVVSTGVNTSAAVPAQVESCKECEMALFAKDEMATSLGDAYGEIARLKTAQTQSSELITRMRELCADKEEQTAALLEECASQKASEARVRRILTQTREVMGAQESFIDSMRRSRRFQQRLDESEGGEEAYDEYLDRKHDLEHRPEEGNAGEGQREAEGGGGGRLGGLRRGEGRYAGAAVDGEEEEEGVEEEEGEGEERNGGHEEGEGEGEGEGEEEEEDYSKEFALEPPPSTYRRPPLPSTGPSLSPRGSERRDGGPTYDGRDYSGRDKEEGEEEEEGEDVLPFGVTNVKAVSREGSPTRQQQQQQEEQEQQQQEQDEDIGVGWGGRGDEPPPPAPPVDDSGSDSDVESDRALGSSGLREREREGEGEGEGEGDRGNDRDDGDHFHHHDVSYMSDLSVDSVAGRAASAAAFRSASTGRGGASSDVNLADKLLADGVESVEDSFSLIQQYYASIN